MHRYGVKDSVLGLLVRTLHFPRETKNLMVISYNLLHPSHVIPATEFVSSPLHMSRSGQVLKLGYFMAMSMLIVCHIVVMPMTVRDRMRMR